jgi:hypothetical protein
MSKERPCRSVIIVDAFTNIRQVKGILEFENGSGCVSFEINTIITEAVLSPYTWISVSCTIIS